MLFSEQLLFLLTFLISVCTPTYIYHRRKMVMAKSLQKFSKKRVFKVTLINLSINVTMYIFFLILLLSILFKTSDMSRLIVMVAMSSLVVIGLSFYGSGIYVASITHKAFTLPELKNLDSYKTQHIATHIFHGPISHVLIFSGYIIVFLLLSVLDIFTGRGSAGVTQYLWGSGAILGLFFGLAQIFNGSIPYQFVTSLVTFLIQLMYAQKTHHSIYEYSVATYFVGFSISFLLVSLIYYFYRGRHKENIWDLSGH